MSSWHARSSTTHWPSSNLNRAGILERGHIELIEGDNSKVMDIAKSLPSGSYWANFIETVTL